MKDKPIYPDLRITDNDERVYADSRQIKLNEGITLLEHYAGLAMQAFITGVSTNITGVSTKHGAMRRHEVNIVAESSIEIAKALIKELEKLKQ